MNVTSRATAGTIIFLLIFGLAFFGLTGGCSSADGPAEGNSTPTASAAPGRATSEGATIPTSGGATIKDTSPPLPDIALIPAFPELGEAAAGDLPIMMRPIPGRAGQFLLVDHAGLVVAISGDSDSRQARPFLDITGRVRTDGREEGLQGLAFDPEFESNGRFYVYYSASSPRRTVLSRFHVGEDGDTATVGSEQVLLEVAQPFANHNGGMIEFGPDGFLYLGLGDGGSSGDPAGNGQNRLSLLGSLLRLDVSSNEASYSVPADNPFANDPGTRGEIWAYGLRNPWRFSFDSATGDLWLADVGQNRLEEVDLIEKGGNYGWNIVEGTDCFRSATCDRSGIAGPVFEYGHDLGCSITGGYVYRGGDIPDLQGAYVYGDFCSGRIWALRYADGKVTEQRHIGTAGQISSFAEDVDGELYVLTFGEGVLRIAPQD